MLSVPIVLVLRINIKLNSTNSQTCTDFFALHVEKTELDYTHYSLVYSSTLQSVYPNF